MKRKLALFLVLMLLVPLTAGAGSQVSTLEPLVSAPIYYSEEMVDETPQAWFIELSGPPEADGGNLASLRKEKDGIRAEITNSRLKVEERYSFDTLWNGISVTADLDELEKIAQFPGVKAIYPVELFSIPEVFPSDAPELYTALAMTGAGYAQNELGYTGEGVKVGIIDTGVDYLHPDLGGGFGPAFRVNTGYDFVGDLFDANPDNPTYNPVAVPDNDPMDGNGHGTHVAGIVGANGDVTGVAPDVSFGAYRVFGNEGSTTAEVMIMAMERALADGMDVINMSIGAAFQWPEYPTATAADRLVQKGVVVVASIGNSGTSGLYAVGAPGVGKDVIGVASFDNTHVYLPSFTTSPDGRAAGYVTATAAPLPPTEGTFEIVRTGTKTTPNDGEFPFAEGSLTGKVALIRRGAVSFYQKALNAQNAGAIAVVLYNNAPGSVNPTVAGAEPITIPVVMISQVDGELIDDEIAAAEAAETTVELTWTSEMVSCLNATGGTISSFSSYGLPPDLSLKPDLGAPGGQIYSTYPLAKGGYATLSGTSMASPHVAGAVALLLQAHPHTPARAVAGILQNTAQPKNWWGNPALGFLDMVHRQGAGMISIVDAIQSTTKVGPSELALGESEHGPSVVYITIENNGTTEETYALSHVPALSSGPNTLSVGARTGFAAVEFGSETVTLAAGKSAKVKVTITANAGLDDGSIYGGYINVTPDNGSTIRVPYVGYKGDYQNKQVVTPTDYGFPWLVKLEGGTYYLQEDNAVYTLQDEDIPYFLLHFEHAAQLIQAKVYDAETGQYMHTAFEEEYIPRNSTAGGFFSFAWDGQVMTGKKASFIPNGSYVVKVSVLKALGDKDNPEHWETWTSPTIKIENPNAAPGKPKGTDRPTAPKDK